MHSIWQEQIDFPVYPILKRDKKTDILYVGATLEHAVEAHFRKEAGNAVMIIEEKSIADMSELGGIGILKDNIAHPKLLPAYLLAVFPLSPCAKTYLAFQLLICQPLLEEAPGHEA